MHDNNVAKSGLHKSEETFLYTIFLRVVNLSRLKTIKCEALHASKTDGQRRI